MQRILSSFTVVVALSTLVACGGKPEAPTAAAPASTPAPAATTAPATAPTSTMAAATTTDGIGVPECDAYITKYLQCVGDKVPDAARAQYRAAFDQAVAAWRQAATTPEGRAGLAAACTQAQAAAAQAMTAYGCTF